jgi:hypothetical protein
MATGKNEVTLEYGLTKIILNNKKVRIEHQGNMGTPIDAVRHNVDHMMNEPGYFDQIMKIGHFYNDGRNIHSDPAYSFILIAEAM